MEYLSLGPAPSGEDCTQLGSQNYDELSRIEILTFIEQIIRHFYSKGIDILKHCSLRSKSFNHDYGSYREAVIYYDPNNSESVEIAFLVEEKIPELWDLISLTKLKN